MSNQSKGRPGGVLPINAVATRKTGATQKAAQRSPAPRLRLIIRRLPPGLTETEFWDVLGAEWQTGNGKVDWHAFKEGKISRDPSKPSKPGRAYVKVKDQSLLEALSVKIKATTFKDAKNTGNDPCLIGPPSLEFAPYNKTPSSRNRHDGRQGTIDQDQEFIDFLQSLTEPITRSGVNGSDNSEAKHEKLTTTPLVQFIKEKKANKAKEKEAAAAAKSAKKKEESKEAKVKAEPRPTVVVKSNAPNDKTRIAKATQEAVKAANKSAAQIQSKATSNKPEPKPAKDIPTPAVTQPAASPAPKPERQRGNASAASRMIARDLGLAPKEPRASRSARSASTATPSTPDTTSKAETPQKAVLAATATVSNPSPASTATPKVVAPAATSTPVQTPPTGPRNNRSTPVPQTKRAQATPQRPTKTTPQPSSGAKSAFLKHANPSQGVTEDLLRTTFTLFGEVARCEIDKKKGLGYIDFTDSESLKKAMTASPIKVGNGQVVVLENKSPYQKRQGQSANTSSQQVGSGVTASGAASVVSSAVTSPQPASAVPAKPEPTANTAATALTADVAAVPDAASSPVPQASTAATPTTPRGGRASNAPARPPRGGAGFPAAARGSANQSQNQSQNRGQNQSASRGRGGLRGRGGRGGRAAGGSGAATGPTSTPSTPSQPANSGGGDGAAKPASGDKAT